MNLSSYRLHLTRNGETPAEIKRNQSNFNFDMSFKNDPTYKKVYILTKDGWKWEDAKYQYHVAQSISSDVADHYLQFKSKVHYPIGTYVIIPDDTSANINLSEEQLDNPFLQPWRERTQWWLIVNRNHALGNTRYNIIPCNWMFKWIHDGKICECFGAVRSANSYTSGTWVNEYGSYLDNLTGAWLPDVFHTYGENYKNIGLHDNRTIVHGMRFLLSNNMYDPKIYFVTKVVDLSPQGIIKLSIKQDDFNSKRDNLELGICDYYTDDGSVKVTIQKPETENEEKTSKIIYLEMNENNELVESTVQDIILRIGQTSYFKVKTSSEIDPQWTVSVIDNNGGNEPDDYYVGIIKITKYDGNIVAIKPNKAGSLKGMNFELAVSDLTGEYYTSKQMEVAND